MPLLETKGAASAQGFGEFARTAIAVYIEEVFSCFIYTGSGTSKTITNSIDLSTYGGLVWTKMRSSPISNEHNHRLSDSAIGVNQVLSSNNTDPKTSSASAGISSFNSDGYTITNPSSNGGWNYTDDTFVSWTFRKQAKFFDVVTYTGTGTASLVVNHSLGSKPGFIAVKRTDSTGNWWCWARASNTQVVTSGGAGTPFALNSTNAGSLTSDSLIVGAADATTFTPYFLTGFSNSTDINGATYVAYLFAHDAGGFGLTGTDNVISCGSFTTDSGGTASVTLGYEPQWVMTKNSSGTSAWRMFDTMRGLTVAGQNDALLQAQSAAAEITNSDYCSPNATGFTIDGHNGSATHIYIAIRRGPMKTPTSGTSVFSPVARVGTGATANITAGFAPDTAISAYRTAGEYMPLVDKLRGPTRWLTWQQSMTNAESTGYSGEWFTAFTNTGVTVGADNSGGKSVNSSGGSLIQYYFQRAPGFFDVVCFNGSNSDFTVNHNLQAIPELIILKRRNGAGSWFVGGTVVGFNASNNNNNLFLNNTNALSTATVYTATWTSSQMFMSGFANFVSGSTAVGYLFATVSGVSKVGSYTGSGTTKQIDCGFTGGARFVLIKRTDSTGDWFVWDSARGIVAGNDPYLVLNNTNAEVTGTDYVDTYSAGFEISSTAPAAINANGGSFVFLAIA